MTEEIPSEIDNSEIITIDRNPTSAKEFQVYNPDNHLKQLFNRQYEQDIKERRKYAVAAYRITGNWVCFLIAITFAQLVARCFGMGLHPEEFIAVITTTTASVFGFWWLVGRYLFKGHDKQPKLKD